MARIPRETFVARVADLLRRSDDNRVDWRVHLLEINLPEALASTEVELTHDEAGRWIQHGTTGVKAAAKVYMLHRNVFPEIDGMRSALELARRREARLSDDPPPAKRTDLAYRYHMTAQRAFRRELYALLQESGAQDVAELIRLLDLNLLDIGTNEDLVLQSIKAGRLIDAANYFRQRVRATREEARAEIERRRRELDQT